MKLSFALFWFVSIGCVLSICQADIEPSAVLKREQLPPVVASDKLVMFEDFQTSDWGSRWAVTHAADYLGSWSVSRALDKDVEGVENDRMLVVGDQARKHGISYAFDAQQRARVSELLAGDGKLWIQYQVRFQNGLECGGAYAKFIRCGKADEPFDVTAFDASTPYTVMFGPDKCGHDDKLHFIVNYRDKKSGEFGERHLTPRPNLPIDPLTHLYALHVDVAENAFSVSIDGEHVVGGSFYDDHFEPPFLKLRQIDDPSDAKPDDWVDEALIDDPGAVKPDGWDEDAPPTIDAPDDEMPDEWLENEPDMIVDPDAAKPADWDDEIDGDWEAPLIPNPLCFEVGCGPWQPMQVPNLDYRGPWTPPKIDNPEFVGEWRARQIDNPEFVDDKHVAQLAPFCGVGFELWTMTDGIAFDDILVTGSQEEADAHTLRFLAKSDAERAQFEASEQRRLAELEGSALDQLWRGVDKAIEFVVEHPVYAAIAFVGALVPILLIFCSIAGPPQPQPNQDQRGEEDDNDRDDNDGDDDDDNDDADARKKNQ
jgi:calnexin